MFNLILSHSKLNSNFCAYYFQVYLDIVYGESPHLFILFGLMHVSSIVYIIYLEVTVKSLVSGA